MRPDKMEDGNAAKNDQSFLTLPSKMTQRMFSDPDPIRPMTFVSDR